MIEDPETRRKYREERVSAFLREHGISLVSLSESTRNCLDDWARAEYSNKVQPSANWSNAIVDLCKAVECELAAGLGSIKGLEFLAAESALGEKIKSLRRFKPDPAVKQRLEARGITTGIWSSLHGQLEDLNAVREAHGGIVLKRQGPIEAETACRSAGRVLKRIVIRKSPTG